MSDSVFVLGSNSFSGASFVDYLLGQGLRVIGASRSQPPHDALLPYRWRPAARGGDFEFHQLDLNHDLDRIMAIIRRERTPWVVNFACQSMVAESWRSPADWFMTNCVSTVKLHDQLRQLDFLERHVHISTPEVYGNCGGYVKEDQVFNPSTPYAVSRAACDMSLRTMRAAYGFRVVTTRAANVYGPGQQLFRIVPRTILFILLGRKLQLHGGGVSSRSFIHMRDVCEATWRIAREGRDGESYHIATAEVIAVRDLVRRICERMGVAFEDHVEIVGELLGKDMSYRLDSGKLRQELGWSDHVSLDEGIDECIDWVRRDFEVLRTLPLDYLHKP